MCRKWVVRGMQGDTLAAMLEGGGVNALLTPPTLQTASDSYEERALT